MRMQNVLLNATMSKSSLGEITASRKKTYKGKAEIVRKSGIKPTHSTPNILKYNKPPYEGDVNNRSWMVACDSIKTNAATTKASVKNFLPCHSE